MPVVLSNHILQNLVTEAVLHFTQILFSKNLLKK